MYKFNMSSKPGLQFTPIIILHFYTWINVIHENMSKNSVDPDERSINNSVDVFAPSVLFLFKVI